MDTVSLTVAPVHQNHRQQTVHTERDHSQPVRSRKDRREEGREGRRDEEGDVGEGGGAGRGVKSGEGEGGGREKWMIITTCVQLYTYMYNSYFTSLFIKCRPF